jgi:cobalt-zinc-cadmium efflux system outer membrane protein
LFRFTLFVPLLLVCHASSALGAGVSLHEALQLAQGANPELSAVRHRVNAARSRTRDAGRWPNPSLDASIENVGGNLGDDRAETSVELAQTVELGGDRAARRGLAKSVVGVVEAESEVLFRDVLSATAARFLDAWSLQEWVRRLRMAEQMASEAVKAADDRNRAGAAPVFERVRAEGFRAQREVERRRTEAELAIARRKLAEQWGADSLAFDSLIVRAPQAPGRSDLASLLAKTLEHPRRRLAAAEIGVEEWRIREARASRSSDVTLTAGVKHLAEIDGTGFSGTVSVPLRLWNGFRGSVSAAESERSAAGERSRFTAIRLTQDLRAAYERYIAAFEAWSSLRTQVIPAAEEVLRLTLASYRAGRLSQLEILESQRSLVEAEVGVIQAASEVWRARMELELLVGTSLEELGPWKEDR